MRNQRSPVELQRHRLGVLRVDALRVDESLLSEQQLAIGGETLHGHQAKVEDFAVSLRLRQCGHLRVHLMEMLHRQRTTSVLELVGRSKHTVAVLSALGEGVGARAQRVDA